MIINWLYALHVLSIVIWVGGMFFAYQVLRPAAVGLLKEDLLLPLWKKVFSRFFPWVWIIVFIVPITGQFILFARFDGFAQAPGYVHLMHGLGMIMIAIFIWIYFVPYKKLSTQVDNENWSEAKKQLAAIRKLIGLNTLIGFFIIFVAASKLF